MAILVNADNWGFNFVQGAEPSDPYENLTWYDTTSSLYFVYRDSDWVEISNLPITTGNLYGYSMGGKEDSDKFSIIDRITFPFDSGTGSIVGNLTQSKYGMGGCNSSNYGYNMGGSEAGGTYFSTIERITFPFDSGTASHVGNLSQTKVWVCGCNSSNYGYGMSGWHVNITLAQSTIDRITFPFNSGTASHVGNLSKSKIGPGSCNSSNYGYSMGGGISTTTTFSTIERITFPFDSGTASHVGNLSQTKGYSCGCNSSNYGYNMGGYVYTNITQSTIERITFPFDSGTATHGGNVSTSKFGMSGCNSTNYGYCMGGGISTSTACVSTIDRITFPFNSGTASHVGNLSRTKVYLCGIDGTDFVTLFR